MARGFILKLSESEADVLFFERKPASETSPTPSAVRRSERGFWAEAVHWWLLGHWVGSEARGVG